jgi:hypothetical protein
MVNVGTTWTETTQTDQEADPPESSDVDVETTSETDFYLNKTSSFLKPSKENSSQTITLYFIDMSTQTENPNEKKCQTYEELFDSSGYSTKWFLTKL